MTEYKYRLNIVEPKPQLCKGCTNYENKCVTTGNWDTRARITFLGESPSWTSISAQSPMMGKNGLLLHKLIRATVSENYADDFICHYNTAYAAGAEGKPLINVVEQCKQIWQTQWCGNFGQQMWTNVIVPLGLLATKSTGITAKKISDIRGKVLETTIGNTAVKVLPTFSLNHLAAKPGLTRVVQRDIKQAIDLAYFNKITAPKTVEELAKGYLFPKTIEEVRQVCNTILEYYDPSKQANPWTWPISVDTETNTLKPYRPDAQVLMISFGWDDGRSTAILLDHPLTPYNKEEAWAEVRRVLESPKPKSFHNAKFDLQFLRCKYGIQVNNIVWDTMLAEHWLDEDRKGTYGLKTMTPLYLEEYQGYDEDLHNALRQNEKPVIDNTEAEEETYEDSVEVAEFVEQFVDPEDLVVFPENSPEGLVQSYLDYRALWKQYDEEGNSKERGKTLRKWKKVALLLNVPAPNPKKSKKSKKDGGFAEISIETLLPYAAIDTDVTRQIQKRQLRKIHLLGDTEDAKNVMSSLYIPGSFTLGQMEYDGTKIDLALAANYAEQLTQIVAECQDKLHELALQDFNIRSNDELSAVMRTCGFKAIKLTAKDKKMALTKEVLALYQQELSGVLYQSIDDLAKDYPLTDANRRLTDAGKLCFVETLMLFRAADGMQSRFIKKIRELSQIDGRIHTSFNLAGTSTGRLSSSNLNLQNIPLYMCRITRPIKGQENPHTIFKGFNVKALFIPDDDDEVFWNLDIKAAEIRVLCYESKDPTLISAVNAGADIHTVFLTKVKHPELNADLNDPLFKAQYAVYLRLYKSGDPDINKFRTAIKRTVFGTLYGAGSRKIAQQLGDESEAGIAFAEEIRKAIFKAFPTIKDYIDRTEKEVDQFGEVVSVFGRRRRFWLAVISRALRSKAIREAVNCKIQSTSSDLVLLSLFRIALHAHEIGVKVKLTVHDSIAGTIKKSRLWELKAFCDKYVRDATKEECAWLPVEWLYDLEVGPNYGEKMPYEKYLEQELVG